MAAVVAVATEAARCIILRSGLCWRPQRCSWHLTAESKWQLLSSTKQVGTTSPTVCTSLCLGAQVIVSGFESGELPNSSALVPVLARLLEFTPADLRSIRAARRRSWLDGLPALPGSSVPANRPGAESAAVPSTDGRPPVPAAARFPTTGMFSSGGTGSNSSAAAGQRT